MCLEWWRVESKLCPWSGGGLSGNFVLGGEAERGTLDALVVKKCER